MATNAKKPTTASKPTTALKARASNPVKPKEVVAPVKPKPAKAAKITEPDIKPGWEGKVSVMFRCTPEQLKLIKHAIADLGQTQENFILRAIDHYMHAQARQLSFPGGMFKKRR